MKKEHKVIFYNENDKDHVYVDGIQYISMSRFAQNRAEIAAELEATARDNERLVEENAYLRKLLKEEL